MQPKQTILFLMFLCSDGHAQAKRIKKKKSQKKVGLHAVNLALDSGEAKAQFAITNHRAHGIQRPAALPLSPRSLTLISLLSYCFSRSGSKASRGT